MSRTLVLVVLLEAMTIAGLALLLASAGQARPDPKTQSANPATQTQVPPARGELTPRPSPARPEEAVFARQAIAQKASPDDPVGMLVYGRITEPRGTPVPEALLNFHSPDGATVRIAESSAGSHAGSYAATGLAPGSWSVSVRASAHVTLERQVTLPDASVYRLDLVVSKATILKVTFTTPDGRPLAPALRKVMPLPWWSIGAVATATPLEGPLPMTSHGGVSRVGVGTWHADPREEGGRLELSRPPPLWVSALLRHVVLASKRVLPGQERVAFTLSMQTVRKQLATLRVRVLDGRTQAPIEGASVSVSAQVGGHGYETDAGGRVVIEDIVPGLLQLGVQSKGHELRRRRIRLERGQELDLGEVTLDQAVTLRGRVTDAGGKPVKATIFWDDLDRIEFPQELLRDSSTGSDAEGEFKIGGLGRGRYVLHARTREHATGWALVHTAQGPGKDIHIRLATATPVRLLGRFGPEQAFTVTLRNARRLPLYAVRLEPGRILRRLFVLPGPYVVVIHDERGVLVRSFDLTVGRKPITIKIP